jgi:hypothetical protein
MSLQSTMRQPGSIKQQEDPSPTFANQTLHPCCSSPWTSTFYVVLPTINVIQCDMQEAMRNW